MSRSAAERSFGQSIRSNDPSPATQLHSKPFAVGSLWALIPAALTMGITVVRTSLEDWTLQDELDGYQEYAGRVRYHLLPASGNR